MSKEQFLALEKKVNTLTLLYVEDNKGLNKQACKIFNKIFKSVIAAENAETAFELFKEHQPEIVITDINMGILNGLELSRMIKKINPFVKIIITSAFDDKEYLLEAIDVNVSKYLKKPITINNLTKAIVKVVDELEFENSKNLFEHYIKDIFQYLDSLLILIKDDEIIIANTKCLEFFSQASIENFKEFFVNFDKQILKHNTFLYNHDDIEWLKSAKESSGKLFNVKIADKDGISKHFILKAYKISEKEDTYILSFDDISDLNLLVMYDKEAMKQEKQKSQRKTIHGILEVVKRNNSSIKVYNSYKGLNISNIGILEEMIEDEIVIQVPYLQLKAIKINNSLVIESELFPNAVFCNIKKIDFENSKVTLNNYIFIDDMPSEQEFIRVEPDNNYKISLFFDKRKIHNDIKILDISVGGAKVALSLLPAGFKEEADVLMDIIFTLGEKPLIIKTKAKVDSLTEEKKEFVVTLVFAIDIKIKKLLTSYVADRQMALIREFKKISLES